MDPKHWKEHCKCRQYGNTNQREGQESVDICGLAINLSADEGRVGSIVGVVAVERTVSWSKQQRKDLSSPKK
jgi:hypothetical protein